MNPFFRFFGIAFSSIGACIFTFMAFDYLMVGIYLATRVTETTWRVTVAANSKICFENVKLTNSDNKYAKATTSCPKEISIYPAIPEQILRTSTAFFFTHPHYILEFKETGKAPVAYDIDFIECLRKSPNIWHELYNYKHDAEVDIIIFGGDKIQISKTLDYNDLQSHDETFQFICENSLKRINTTTPTSPPTPIAPTIDTQPTTAPQPATDAPPATGEPSSTDPNPANNAEPPANIETQTTSSPRQ